MALEFKQTQRLDLRMTPQLQQAIKLLQLTRLELVEMIQNELVENPLLEEAPDPTDWEVPQTTGIEQDLPATAPSTDDSDARKAVNEIEWESYLENLSSPLPGSAAGGFDDELPGIDQTLTRAEGLTEHLLWQLGMADANDDERRLAEVLIRELDDEGYLRDVTLDEVATREGVDLDIVEGALMLVQELDPVGVGARDLAECLLLQANSEWPDDSLVRDVIQHHLGDLERKNYAVIARALRATREEVIDAHRRIRTLDPRPGSRYTVDEARYIVPDITVVRQGDEWVPILNEDGLPRLRVSEHYRRSLRASSEKDARNYVQERLRSAWWLIRSIQQRQRTILKVTESIIRFQREFFDKGVECLRPLVLREVADDIGMHESTISRVTSGKYVHTPRGIFELKYFFNSSIRRTDADDLAAEAVKHRIRELVASEPPDKPHSDQKLVEVLQKEYNIEIARRTVAKYREMLGILSSSKRRRFD